MRNFSRLAFAAALLAATGCYTRIEVPVDDGYGGYYGYGGYGYGGYGDTGGSYAGMPCRFLAGEATLTSYTGPGDVSAQVSFEFGSQDPAVTGNDWDLQYEQNVFRVNTVTDDTSFIVDLGDVPLAQVPQSVDPAGYPTGQFGGHDDLQAVVAHTYVVRTLDGSTRQWAAFRVTSLSPGESVGITWVRSADPDALKVPLGCL